MHNNLIEKIKKNKKELSISDLDMAVSSIVYCCKMFWIKRFNKFDNNDIDFYLWLTNNFLSIEYNITKEQYYKNDDCLFANNSHLDLEILLSLNIKSWYISLKKDELKKINKNYFESFLSFFNKIKK